MSISYGLSIVLLLLCSAFFSASETAFTSVNALRLKKSAEGGNRVARVAYGIYSSFDAAISAILIGNNLVNTAASSMATVVLVAMFGEGGAGVASLVMTALILLFGEITPKIIAKQQPDRAVLLFAYPLKAIMLVLTPVAKAVVFLVDKLTARLLPGEAEPPSITEDELSAILDQVEDEGVIDGERTDLLQSALTFDETSIHQVMTPRVSMVALDVDDDLHDQLREVLESGYSRIPVYEDTIDNIVGILHVNRFLEEMVDKGHADVRGMLMQPLFLHKTMTLDEALKKMRRRQLHIAIVLDEYGGTLGMVTMEDVLEELVGEIWDEDDDVELDCESAGEDVWLCSGTLPIHELFDEIDYEPRGFESEYVTLGGWAVEMLDAEPEERGTFEFGRLRVTVLKMDGPRVMRLKVELRPEAEDA